MKKRNLSRLNVCHLERRDAPTVTPDGMEFRANTYSTNTQAVPAIAMDADGDSVIVWESLRDGSGFGIYGQRFDKTGTATGTEFQVNNYTTNDQRSPSVAMDATGGFVVVFESFGQDGSNYGVYARRFNNSGVAQGNAFLVNTTTADTQFRPAVAMDSDGDFVVAWENYNDGGGAGIAFQRFSNTGSPIGGESQANVTTTQFQVNPAISIDSDGDFVIAWQSYLQDGDGYGVYARRFNNGGAPQGGEFRPNQFTTDQQQEPVVALDSDGDFVIAWESFGQDGSRMGVFARRYDRLGNAQGGEFLVNDTSNSDQRTPSIAMAANGDFVINWSSLNQEPASYGIYASRFLANGTSDGNEFHVNTYTTNHQTRPASASDNAGTFVTVWQSDLQDGASSGIYAQRFKTTLPPKLQAVQLNDGASQRSRITSITVRFDQAVNFAGSPSAAFSLTGPNGGITLGVDTVTMSTPNQTVAIISFTGPNTTNGSVNDGNYSFTIIANQISGPGGSFDGNGNGVGGDSFNFSFFRLFGDLNGDRTVNATDFALFRSAFGTGIGSSAFLWSADEDGNGTINAADFAAFRARFGITI